MVDWRQDLVDPFRLGSRGQPSLRRLHQSAEGAAMSELLGNASDRPPQENNLPAFAFAASFSNFAWSAPEILAARVKRTGVTAKPSATLSSAHQAGDPGGSRDLQNAPDHAAATQYRARPDQCGGRGNPHDRARQGRRCPSVSLTVLPLTKSLQPSRWNSPGLSHGGPRSRSA